MKNQEIEAVEVKDVYGRLKFGFNYFGLFVVDIIKFGTFNVNSNLAI
jgi:hypothetical protein